MNSHIYIHNYNCADTTKVVDIWCLNGGRVIIQVNVENKWLQLRCLSLQNVYEIKRSMGAGQNNIADTNKWTDLCLV